MMRYCFLILFVISVVCDDTCVTYDFEDGFEEFTNEYRVCIGLTEWSAGDYSSLLLDSPHANSNTFISPGVTMSCISSFKFQMSAQGSVEVNFYMDPSSTSDQLSVLAFQSIDNFNDPTVGATVVTASSPSFVSGWQKIRFSVSGSASFVGYLTFMGLASTESILIVDSFKFIPLAISNEDDCLIYEDKTETTTTESTTSATTTMTITTTTGDTIITTTETITTTTETITTTTEIITTSTPTTIYPESAETDDENTVTESPIIDKYTFWNVFTISMVVLLTITILALTFCIFHHIGRKRSSKEDPEVIIDDKYLPELKVPRVNTANSNRFNSKMLV